MATLNNVTNLEHIKRYTSEAVFNELRKIHGDAYDKYRNEWALAAKEQVKESRPSHLLMEITSSCNLKCKMCYRNYRPARPDSHMPLAVIDKIVKDAKELKVPSIFIGYGSECLMHPEIKTVINNFSNVGAMDYWIISNGTLLTPSISEAIINAQVTMFSISLDAALPETYKKIRGEKYSLDEIENNIIEFINMRERMNKTFPRLRLTFVKMEDNKDEIELFTKKWEPYADMIDFQNLMDYKFHERDLKDIVISGDYHCEDPFSRVAIRCDGEIYPCAGEFYDPIERMYITDMTLLEFWNSKSIEEMRVAVKNRDFMKCCIRCVAARQDRIE